MRLSVSTRIFLGFVVVIVAFGSANVYTLWRMTTLRESVNLIWEEVMPISSQLKDLSRRLRAPEEFLDLRQPSDAQWLSRLLPTLQPFEQLRAVEARLERLVQEEAIPAQDRAMLGLVARRLQVFRRGNALAEAVGLEDISLLTDVPGEVETESLFDWLVRRTVKLANEGALVPRVPEARAMVRSLRTINRVVIEASRAVSQPIRDLNARAAADEKAATLAVLVITSGALLLSLGMLFVIQRTLLPLRRLREGARRIAAGDYDERVTVRSRDEIGQLAQEFNTMAEALRARDAELARQREELLRADRLATIGKLAAQITHEVRNPLSSIGLNAEMLEEELEELSDTEESRALLGEIHQEVQRLKSITEEYLTYARLPRPELAPVDVGALLRQVLSFLEPELAASGAELAREGVEPTEAGGPPVILADADQLRQAWLNVARNAREALEEVEPPRRLVVRLEEAGRGGVRVTFTDNGPGIDPAIRDRIFEPFVTGKSGGTGLGLALTQQIVADHGGVVEVEARPGGTRGTVFSMLLPSDGGRSATLRGSEAEDRPDAYSHRTP